MSGFPEFFGTVLVIDQAGGKTDWDIRSFPAFAVSSAEFLVQSLMTLGEVQLVGANGAAKTHYVLKHLFINSFGYFCFYLPHQVLHGAT